MRVVVCEGESGIAYSLKRSCLCHSSNQMTGGWGRAPGVTVKGGENGTVFNPCSICEQYQDSICEQYLRNINKWFPA